MGVRQLNERPCISGPSGRIVAQLHTHPSELRAVAIKFTIEGHALAEATQSLGDPGRTHRTTHEHCCRQVADSPGISSARSRMRAFRPMVQRWHQGPATGVSRKGNSTVIGRFTPQPPLGATVRSEPRYLVRSVLSTKNENRCSPGVVEPSGQRCHAGCSRRTVQEPALHSSGLLQPWSVTTLPVHNMKS